MRRAPLLLLLVAPAIAAAQATPADGQVTFDNEFISSTECAGSGDILLSWDIRPTSGTVQQGGRMQVWASNVSPQTDANCPPAAGDGRFFDEVGPTITDYVGDGVSQRPYAASLFVAPAGKSCSDTADQQIFVCVQYIAPGGTDTAGQATGVLTLSVSAPAAPTILKVGPGERALNVEWEDGGGSTPAVRYEVFATSFDPLNPTSVDPRDPSQHSSGRIVATGYRFEGLVNDVSYAVVAIAYSAADTPSAASAAVTGIPKDVNDFWETYQAAGGQEQGGCASGGAGTFALAGLASLLAVLVRRRR
jgi:uncharacterized protein (TIGR03382 family)